MSVQRRANETRSALSLNAVHHLACVIVRIKYEAGACLLPWLCIESFFFHILVIFIISLSHIQIPSSVVSTKAQPHGKMIIQ